MQHVVKSLLLEIQTLSHAPLDFRVQYLPSMQLVSSSIPLNNLPSVHQKYKSILEGAILFYLCTFLFCIIFFGIPLSSFFFFPIDLLWQLEAEFLVTPFCPYMVLYFSAIVLTKLMITFLFMYLPPPTDCRVGSGLSLCFIDSATFRM